METKLETIKPEVNSEILKAFHLMWDSFPSPVRLLRKDRTVVACNQAAVQRGFGVGEKCFAFSGDKSVHKHCKANEALRDQVGQRAIVHSPVRQTVSDSYWLPIPGEKDLFVHAVINITQYAKPELFQS
jgi:hypothetical protein